MIALCLNCNKDYDQEIQGAICPHESGDKRKDSLPPWPKGKTVESIDSLRAQLTAAIEAKERAERAVSESDMNYSRVLSERDEARVTIQRQAERIAELERQVQEAGKVDSAQLAETVVNWIMKQKYQGEDILHAAVCCDFVGHRRFISAIAKQIDAAIAAPEQEKP